MSRHPSQLRHVTGSQRPGWDIPVVAGPVRVLRARESVTRDWIASRSGFGALLKVSARCRLDVTAVQGSVHTLEDILEGPYYSLVPSQRYPDNNNTNIRQNIRNSHLAHSVRSQGLLPGLFCIFNIPDKTSGNTLLS